MKRTSTAYLATYETNSPVIKDLRKFVSKCNRMLKEDGRPERYYVKLHGRGRRFGNRKWKQELPLAYAEKVDVYIYERYSWNKPNSPIESDL